MIPGREIQDALPLPFAVNDGGEAFRLEIDTPLCNMELVFDNLVLQVANVNFEKMSFIVTSRESISLTLPFGLQGTVQVNAKCLLYKPRIFFQYEYAATFTPHTDICIDLLGIGDLPNILNYTYATVNTIDYKADAQNIYWCIYDALPLLESIINDALEENIHKIWIALDAALVDTILPGAVTGINSALRAIGIKPYNESLVEEVPAKPWPQLTLKQPRLKRNDTVNVIQTTSFNFIYNDKGTGSAMDITVYRPTTTQSGYFPLGDWAQRNYDAASGIAQMVADDGGIVVQRPVDYQLVWESRILFSDYDGSVWRPVPPAGYVAVGHVFNRGYGKPSTDLMRVIRADCVVRCDPWLVWNDRCGKASDDVGVWGIAETTSSPLPGTFISTNNHNKPGDETLYCLNPECIATKN